MVGRKAQGARRKAQGAGRKGPGDVVEHGALGDLLLVDDEESVSITMQAILEEDGHRTEGATTAAARWPRWSAASLTWW